MSSINDLLNKRESHSFVGRHTELQLMQEQLLLEQTHWQILHFFAIKGMGKTALLKSFEKSFTSTNIIYIQTDSELQNPHQFLYLIGRKIDLPGIESKSLIDYNDTTYVIADIVNHLNALATHDSPLILLFDSLELWTPIHKWLFESFIPNLSVNIRLCTAGRDPLDGEWLSISSWNLLVKNIPLKPLKHHEVLEYLKLVGIDDSALQHTIIKLSYRIPFAINLCCNMVHEDERQFENEGLKQTIQILCQYIFNSLQMPTKYYPLLEAASVVGQFDKELLNHITKQSLSYEEFHQFCSMPIVVKRIHGWSLVDGVRNWIQTNFKEHSPELFNRCKKRALEVLQRRWSAATPLKRRSLFLENVYAAKNELLSEYYFLGDESIYDIRTAQEQDLPFIESTWRNRHDNNLEYVNDGTKQEKLFRVVWQLEPSSIKAFWLEGCIVGFASIVLFTKEARKIFYDNELYRNYLNHTKTEENERLFWVAGTAEKNDYETLNVIFRYLFEQLMDNCLYTVLFPTDYDISGLLSLGFSELPWAASVSPSGKKFRMLQLDLREMSLLRLLTTSYPNKSSKSLTHVEAIEWMKKTLVSFHDLAFDRDLLEKAIVILGKNDDVVLDEQTIRSHIQHALQKVASKSEKDQLLMRILQLTYIDCIGSNEIVAERLHLSISTFYRYLKNGIEKLAQQLIYSSSTPHEFQ